MLYPVYHIIIFSFSFLYFSNMPSVNVHSTRAALLSNAMSTGVPTKKNYIGIIFRHSIF